jgi:hypothetical protein
VGESGGSVIDCSAEGTARAGGTRTPCEPENSNVQMFTEHSGALIMGLIGAPKN